MKQTDSAIGKVMAKINKDVGEDIAYLGDEKDDVEVIPSGILPLDFALGCGGFPRGRVTDVFGHESVGKSSICYVLIASAQKMGISCGLLDAENSFMPDYAEFHGVDSSKLLVVSPDCFEDGAEAVEAMVKGGIGLIVIDSVSSMVPRPEAEAEHGKAPMAIQARLMSQMLRKLVAPIAKHNTALVCINQMRANLMSTHAGDRYTVTGGFALKFYASIRLKVARIGGLIDDNKTHTGSLIGFTVAKNKIANPGGKAEVRYFFDKGFEKEGDLVKMGLENGVFTREGNAVLYEGMKIGRGHDDAASYLEATPDVKQKVISALFPHVQ